jgi:serine/threonine-protein kinase
MSHVYQARCSILNRIVTVKILRSELAEDKEFVRRFQMEAQAVASLSHPNIVSIYDVGQENGVPYLVMEYVEGQNLKEIISREGPLSPAEVVNLGVQVCAALAHAHEKGIIHRDIKSQNILVTPGGRVKVTDFGLARVLSMPSATVTQSGTVMGSVHYFSPEQARGEETGPKSDLYSLGVVLYEAISGHVPFQGDNPITVALKHLQGTPSPLRRERPDIPARLEEIVFKALAKDPAQRFQSARKMQQALSEGGLSQDSFNENEMTQELRLPAGAHRRRLRPVALAGLVLVLLLAVIGGAYAFARWYAQGSNVTVPQVVNKSQSDAIATLKAAGLEPSVKQVNSDTVPSGVVVSQDPVAGYGAKKGQQVILSVSMGPASAWLPNVVGFTVADAKAALGNNGFQPKVTYQVSSDPSVAPGTVIDQKPPGDSNVPRNSEVYLTVSQTPAAAGNLIVPSLLGQGVDQARATLKALGLVLGNVNDESSRDYPSGMIDRQDVPPGTPVSPGTVVNVWRSAGPGPKMQNITVHFNVYDTGEVKVVINDALGSGRVVYDQVQYPGDVLNKNFEFYGAGTVQIYFKGSLVESHSYS